MKTSLIITTFNWKEALDLALRSVARQVELPDEIIIADDGSRPDTAELVRSWAARLPAPLIHVWQEDQGFRASRVRNLAIAAAAGEYLVIVDGDLVLHSHFVLDHKRAARAGHFIQGVRLLTEPELGRRMLAEGRLDLGVFANGIKRRRHALWSPLLSRVFNWCPPTSMSGIRSCNQGYWKADLLRVNGFNEQMIGWGDEDLEIVLRLFHLGVRRRNLRFGGLTIHLHHPNRETAGENPNRKILEATRSSRSTWCAVGLDQHLPEPPPVKRTTDLRPDLL